MTKYLVVSREWAEKSANQGNGVGQLNLAMFYYHGHGVAKDFGAAREWLEKSSGQGNGDAQVKLEDMVTNEGKGEQSAPQEPPVLVDKGSWSLLFGRYAAHSVAGAPNSACGSEGPMNQSPNRALLV